jgi:hypothetical protein
MNVKKEKNQSRKNGTLIHPSSQKAGTGSGNLYKHQANVGNVIDKQWKPSR